MHITLFTLICKKREATDVQISRDMLFLLKIQFLIGQVMHE